MSTPPSPADTPRHAGRPEPEFDVTEPGHTASAQHGDLDGGGIDHSVPTPSSTPGIPVSAVAKALVFPLYFIIVFSACYISAFHDPAPRGASIAISGPSQSAPALAAGIESESGDQFEVTVLADADQAREQVESRDVVGALVVGDTTVTSLVAGGEGSALVSAVTALGSSVAEQADLTPVTKDLAPVADGDTTGSALFYFVIVCTIGGYLTMTVLGQGLPSLGRRRALATLAAMSVATPLLSGLVGSIFFGTLGAGFGAVLMILGLSAIYCFTAGAITMVSQRLFGSAAIMVVLLVVVFLNFPSAGGGIPAAFLPDFWQVLHEFWFGAAITETLRDIVYFPGASRAHYLSVLAIWFVASTVLAAAIPARRSDPASTVGVEAGGVGA